MKIVNENICYLYLKLLFSVHDILFTVYLNLFILFIYIFIVRC